ncbi:zinc finger MYM-type protein 1-like [Macrobrachium rosenbergii]|uniref:zinc finger MYM-type protein 1-like n=1 Tax=Macrobrachium rosenbergii TaxID=79674 RepID=UPI0034D7B6C8
MALFDPVMSEHLRKIRNEETHVHYLGKNIQNELIDILANAIKEEILRNARAAKYFSIILDSTPDVSHVEQMTVIIRFVQVDEDNAVIAVREHFLGYVPLQETTGAFMAETILEEFKKMDLCIDNLRGQGYDNGSNMKGKHNGVQKKILQRNPRALFVPCSAHTLNLVVNDAASCCLEATNFFGLIQKLYVFFSASTHRWDVLKRHVQRLTVKPLSETRWESRIDALKPIRYQIGDIYDALTEMATKSTLLGSSGNSTRAEAKALANGIATFKFLVSLIVWYDILFEINITSKQLQAKENDISSALKQLERTRMFLEERRSDTEFEKVLVDATELANDLEIDPFFLQIPFVLGERKGSLTMKEKTHQCRMQK